MCKTWLFHMYVGWVFCLFFFSLQTVNLCNHCCDDHAAQYTSVLKPVSKMKTIGSNEDVDNLAFMCSAFFLF